MTEPDHFIAHEAVAVRRVAVPGREGTYVGLLVEDCEETPAMWLLEEGAVPHVLSLLAGSLSDNSVRILKELSKTDIITDWHLDENEETGIERIHLTLYGQVSCDFPVYEADAALHMLTTVLHAQGHVQLGD